LSREKAQSSELPHQFQHWLDSAVIPFVELVGDISANLQRNDTSTRFPHGPVHVINAEELRGDLILFVADELQRRVAFAVPDEGRSVGLHGKDFDALREVVTKTYERREINSVLGDDSLWKIVAEWLIASYRKEPVQTFSATLSAYMVAHVRPNSIWVPIDGMALDDNLIFADCIFRYVDSREVDDLFRRQGPPEDPKEAANVDAAHEALLRGYAGRVVCDFKIVAESEHAHRIAVRKTRTYCSILQLLGDAVVIPNRTSAFAPKRLQPFPLQTGLWHNPSSFGWTEGITASPSFWSVDITRQRRDMFMWLSVLAANQQNQHQRKMLDSLELYGNAAYQTRLVDKILYVTSALEMSALKTQGEPISHTIGDRLAFAITQNAAQRKIIAEDFRDVYALRSKRTHHGSPIEPDDRVVAFLGNVYRWFLVMVATSAKYSSTSDYLDHLDRLKYGSEPPD
jgi:hypothetical protein